jgi:hypothetical protein
VGPQCTLRSYGTFSGSEYYQCDSFKIRRLIDLADRRANHKIRQRSRAPGHRANAPIGATAQLTCGKGTHSNGATDTCTTCPAVSKCYSSVTSAPEQCAPGTYSNVGNGGLSFFSFAHGLRYLSQTSFTLRTLVRTVPRRPLRTN